LICRKILNVRANQEDVCKVIELLERRVGLLVHIAMEANIPPLIRPIAVRGEIEDIRRKRR
jgi:hypothetical protein